MTCVNPFDFISDTKDLIHEGIATPKEYYFLCIHERDTKDLIHEGIATVPPDAVNPTRAFDTKDLIHEGIATRSARDVCPLIC